MPHVITNKPSRDDFKLAILYTAFDLSRHPRRHAAHMFPVTCDKWFKTPYIHIDHFLYSLCHVIYIVCNWIFSSLCPHYYNHQRVPLCPIEVYWLLIAVNIIIVFIILQHMFNSGWSACQRINWIQYKYIWSNSLIFLECVVDCYHDICGGLVQKDVTPLLTHWSYVLFALTHCF